MFIFSKINKCTDSWITFQFRFKGLGCQTPYFKENILELLGNVGRNLITQPVWSETNSVINQFEMINDSGKVISYASDVIDYKLII